jgi:hypothetical protein
MATDDRRLEPIDYPVDPVEFDRSMVVNAKSARIFFVAALGLYILWFGALVGLAIVSADRPATTRLRPVAVPAPVRGDTELPKD